MPFSDFRWKLHMMIEPWDRLGLIRSLVLGEPAEPRSAQWLRTLGFVHLYTATGIHLYAMSRWLLTLGRVGKAVTPVCWVSAWALAGFRLGMCRPLIIVLLRFGADRLGIRWRLYFPLVASLVIELLAAAFLHGWQGVVGIWGSARLHYALAVGGGLLAVDVFGEQRSGFRVHLALALGSWVFVAFLQVLHATPIAVFTPILSLISIPWMANILFPALLVLLPLNAEFPVRVLVEITNQGLELAVRVLYELDSFVPMLWVVSLPTLIFGFLVLALCWRFRLYGKIAVLISLLGFRWLASSPYPEPSRVEDWVQLQVGQGDSAWVRLQSGQSLLVDAGPETRKLEPWLKRLSGYGASGSKAQIAAVLLSHLDSDHVRGIMDIAPFLKIGCVVADSMQWKSPRGQELAAWLGRHHVPIADLEAPCFDFAAAGIQIQSRWNSKMHTQKKGNDLMTGVWIQAKDFNFWALGDSSFKQEKAFLPWLKQQLKKNPGVPRIAKVSHHGSCYSSSPELLALRPDYSFLSVGARNPYGHPCLAALQRWRNGDIRVLRTDQSGDLSVRAIITEAGVRRRSPWFHP